MAENLQDDSAPATFFKTPEILQGIMSHLSIEDFVRTQAGHRHFMDVALLYPVLRQQFFLEADSKLREKPVINPLFETAVNAGGWHFKASSSRATHKRVEIRCEKMRSSEHDENEDRLPGIPPHMLICQPPAEHYEIFLSDGPISLGRRKIHVATGHRYRARYSGTDPTLREKVDAILAAQRINI